MDWIDITLSWARMVLFFWAVQILLLPVTLVVFFPTLGVLHWLFK